MTTSGKRSGLLIVGIVILIVGLLAGIGLWYSAGQREADAVRNLARAPIGCDTTLDFEASGEYLVFIETAGRFDPEVAGDCGAEGSYGILGDELPSVALSLRSPDGDDVALESKTGISYDIDGFTGESLRTFEVTTPGDHVLRAEAPGSSEVMFAVAVGRDPADGVGIIRLGAAIAAIAGLLGGGLLVMLARRSTMPEPAATDQTWSSDPAAWPSNPPGMPAAPPPSGWQPAVGPPTQYPTAPPAVPAPAPPSRNEQPGPPHAVPDQVAPDSPWAPTPDGSTGDGQRSPWAAPTDPPQ